jgi:cytoskeletal protein CcmA (bactofilin family)
MGASFKGAFFMAMQTPFFGKRDPEPAATRHHVPPPPLQARNAVGVHAVPTTPAPAAPAPVQPQAAVASEGQPQGGSKLTVGPNIKLKGVEITDCDTLLVEGIVEATMDSRLMQIAASGSFRGSAEIDIAEIHGQFDGSLTVREKLVIHATGRVSGQIRYGKLVVEEGGQLSGDVVHGTAGGATAAGKPVLQAA